MRERERGKNRRNQSSAVIGTDWAMDGPHRLGIGFPDHGSDHPTPPALIELSVGADCIRMTCGKYVGNAIRKAAREGFNANKFCPSFLAVARNSKGLQKSVLRVGSAQCY